MNKLAPSILSADFSILGSEIKKVEEGGADYIHIDVMDGKFVPNITLGPPIIKSIRKTTDLPFDVHLMINNPELYIQDFYNAGADIITVHQEACIHLHRVIQNIKSYGIKAGVAINPATNIDTIKYLLDDIDMVLLMSVNPGFGGQKLIKSVKEKLYDLKNILIKRNLEIDIEIDGGINRQNIKEVISWGANIIVAGSAIYKSDDIINETALFKKLMLEV